MALTDQDKQFLLKLKAKGVPAEEAFQRLNAVKAKIANPDSAPSSGNLNKAVGNVLGSVANTIKNPANINNITNVALGAKSFLDSRETPTPESTVAAKEAFAQSDKERDQRAQDVDYLNKMGITPGAEESAGQISQNTAALKVAQNPVGAAMQPLNQVGKNIGENIKSGAGEIVEGAQTFASGFDPNLNMDATEKSRLPMQGLQKVINGALGIGFSPVTGAIDTLPNEIKKPVSDLAGAPNWAVGEGTRAIVKQLRPDLDDEFIQKNVVEPMQTAFNLYLMKNPKILGKAGEKIGEAVGKVKNVAKSTAEFAVDQATGLNPSTVKTAIRSPEMLTEAQKMGVDASRQNVFQAARKAVDDTKSELASTGKSYAPIRDLNIPVRMPSMWLENNFKKVGLELVTKKDGQVKIKAKASSKLRDAGDINALQGLYDLYKGKDTFTTTEFLNLRDDLAGLSRFGKETTKDIQPFSKRLRKELNEIGRPQVNGLKELDMKFTKIKSDLKAVEDAIYKKNGDIHDNAISRINNLVNKGKEFKLENFKKIIPDFDKFVEQIKVVKALEDVELAKGQKVGTYARPLMQGVGAATGNIPVILATILAQPSVAIAILKKYGKLKGKSIEIIKSITNKIKTGKKLLPYEALFAEEALKKVKKASLPALVGAGQNSK